MYALPVGQRSSGCRYFSTRENNGPVRQVKSKLEVDPGVDGCKWGNADLESRLTKGSGRDRAHP
jgi:hypothetical protein